MSSASDFVIENGVLTKYVGPGGDVVVPEEVAEIGDHVFSGCRNLTSITLPAGVTSIGDWAFVGCESLTSISLPESVTSIGNGVFEGCSSLTSVVIPAGVTSISDRAFWGCSSLASITLPESLRSIGERTFCNCSRLADVTIPNGVTNIGDRAFYSCRGLTCLELPEGLTEIRNEVFSGCVSLVHITVPAGVYRIGDSAFSECSSLVNVTVMEGVKELRNRAFSFCTNLAEVELPKSIKKIGSNVFMKCPRVHISAPAGSFAEKFLQEEIVDPGERCERKFAKWRELFIFSMRSKGAHISGCIVENPIIYIPDCFGNSPIEGFEKNAIPQETIILCSKKIFAKLPEANKLTTLKAALEKSELFTEEESMYLMKYIKGHQAKLIDIFLAKHDIDFVKKTMALKKLSPKDMDEILRNHEDAETRVLILSIQNDLSCNQITASSSTMKTN